MKQPWKGYVEPFRMWGNLYFVGTEPASVHIIDTGEGLIMLDTGYQQSLYLVIHNMHLLGLKPENLKYIMLTHGHIDHIGGARCLKELTGAKIVLGRPDREYVNGEKDLSFAKELGMKFNETFEPDILIEDGEKITLGNTEITAVATPGHTPGAMSFFFDVYDGERTMRAGLHGGMGINTLTDEFLSRYNLPFSLRDDFRNSMKRLNMEHVDIFLGNHMQHNDTLGKAERLKSGEKDAFVDPTEWAPYNEWCIENLKNVEK
ncbi:MAG: MBL fold metallo-hydrolase [Clostridia bacterium]|nr:MBL fold metallo-hydrolase [Clostridia bacterium]MBQ6895352.1 MBL fold metallo-hydrolase [Clostridia bacterium]